MQRDLGIIVFPEFFQTEGVAQVLDNLQRRTGLDAIATSPYVMRPTQDGDGGREPPIDGGAGSVRLLDRPLWGRRELFVRTSVAYEPNRSFYQGLRYQPPAPDSHTSADGALVGKALAQARQRGLRTYLQIQAAIPPGYRVQFGGPDPDDEPRHVDGSIVADRLDKNGSLASPHIRDYTVALLKDLAHAYPDIDGFHIDWPEYPPYTLDSAFLDFGHHARSAAARMGLDFDGMVADAAHCHAWLTQRLTLDELARGQANIAKFPGVIALCDFKARLAAECAAAWRAAVPGKQIVLRSFPPPWTAISGFSFEAMAPFADAISVKLFTMHWPMMVGSWTARLLRDNPALGSTKSVAPLIARIFDIADAPEEFGDAIAQYPEPNAAHPVGAAAMVRKIETARRRSAPTSVYAMAHGYGPLDDFRARLSTAWASAARKVWINRYGYLSDEKLDAVGQVCHPAPTNSTVTRA
jgi:hypothetical protein